MRSSLVYRTLKKARLLTRPTLASTSPARPESAKTASRPRTRLIPCKAAASYHFIRAGWNDPKCAQRFHPPTHWQIFFTRPILRLLRNRFPGTCHLPRRGPSGFPHFPLLFFSSRALREHGDRPSHPATFFSVLLIVRWFEVARWTVLPGDCRLFGLFDEATQIHFRCTEQPRFAALHDSGQQDIQRTIHSGSGENSFCNRIRACRGGTCLLFRIIKQGTK